jgi:hypothetical protein
VCLNETDQIKLPVAIIISGWRITSPESWACRAFKIWFIHEVDRGGHFALWELNHNYHYHCALHLNHHTNPKQLLISCPCTICRIEPTDWGCWSEGHDFKHRYNRRPEFACYVTGAHKIKKIQNGKYRKIIFKVPLKTHKGYLQAFQPNKLTWFPPAPIAGYPNGPIPNMSILRK